MNEDSLWNQTLLKLQNPHLLQTSEWAALKAEVGWQSIQKTWKGENGEVAAAASILKRTIRPFKTGPSVSVLYIPRGPILDWGDTTLCGRVFADLEDICRQERAIFIKIDGEIPLGTGIPGSENALENPVGNRAMKFLAGRGWKISPEQIQFKNTMILDLQGDEESWLKRMKQKTRYNLRLAQKNGVIVRRADSDELPGLYQMYAETSVRDGFVIRDQGYYLDVWQRFINAGKAFPLVAEVDDESVAGLVLFVFGKRAWFLHGMSTQKHREKMPNYLLQWEAMRLARSLGCDAYDLWGAPDQFDATDRMFGVFRFKEGLGAQVVRTPGALDYVCNPTLYYGYMKVLPRILGLMRKRRTAQTRQEVL